MPLLDFIFEKEAMELRSRKQKTKQGAAAGYSHSGEEAGLSTGASLPFKIFHEYLGPLFFCSVCPWTTQFIWYTAAKADGSFLEAFRQLMRVESFADAIRTFFPFPSFLSVSVVFGYLIFALILHIIVPGKKFEGPISPKGHIPIYKDNGLRCYFITLVSLLVLTVVLKRFDLSPSIVYDRWGEVLCVLNFFAYSFCALLYFKGILFPSSVEHGRTGSFMLDFFWGTELYPRIKGVDVKVFTNCRFGMNVWALANVLCTIKSYEVQGQFVLSSTVSAIIHLAYLTKFFWWEAGYMRTLDIMLDRAGFYICWGCLVWVPGFYTIPSLYLAKNAPQMELAKGLLILVVGLAAIALNYDADRQKLHVRKENGDCQVWGSKAQVIRASYKLESGETKESLLLVSGWWGIARHFNYVPELMLALAWSLPGGSRHIMPYVYFLWLILLLTHRTFRDDAKCMKKYGDAWAKYKKAVPYKMLPYIF